MNRYISISTLEGDYLAHYGRKGMKQGEEIFGDDDAPSGMGTSRRVSTSAPLSPVSRTSQNSLNSYAKGSSSVASRSVPSRALSSSVKSSRNSFSRPTSGSEKESRYSSPRPMGGSGGAGVGGESLGSRISGNVQDAANTVQNAARSMNRSEVYLAHHGIKGQKWGVRRYQNPDGTYTELGKRRNRSEQKGNTKRADDSYALYRKEKLREKIIRHPTRIRKYSKNFTSEELSDIIAEINIDRQMRDVRQKDISRRLSDYKNITNFIGTTASLATSMKTIYNVYAGANNALINNGYWEGSRGENRKNPPKTLSFI